MNESIFVIEFEAVPVSEGAEIASGAYANVYVLAANCEVAIGRAKREVESAGWCVTEMTGAKAISMESFEPESHGLAYYEQCKIDGVVIVLHTWRNEH
jgi:hypothetical protein